MRSLINTTTTTGYPVTNQPLEHSVLVFEDGTLRWEFISPGGGVSIVQSVGTGASIIKSLILNVLTLKSLKGVDQNIIVNALTDEISVKLNTDLNFAVDQNFHLDDGGSATLINLIFRATFGIFSSIPMQINNQGRIDINGITYFNSVVDGTPFANKFLAIDSNNKLILSEPIDNTTASNFPGTNFKWFMGKVGNDLEFRSFDNGLNIQIGINAAEYVFSVTSNLNQIQQINPNIPRSPFTTTFEPNNLTLRIGSENIYLDNMDYLNPARFMVLATDGKIEKQDAVTTLIDVGVGSGLSAGVTGEIAKIKSLIGGRNIELTSSATDVTLDLAVNLENIFNINALTPFPLSIYNAEINLPSITTQTWNSTRKNLWINSTNELCKGYSCNTISNAGTNSLISNDTISIDGNIALKGLVAGSNITLTPSGTDITISATASDINIYGTDGTSTDSLRIFNGKTPGDLNNKIAFNDVNLNLTNSLPYNRTYIGTTPTTSILGFNDGGTYSKFLETPYNYLSTRVDVALDAGYGQSTIFYQSTANIALGNIDWIFEVEAYEQVLASPQAFIGRWKFSTNSASGANSYYVQPYSCTPLNTSPQNVCGLEFYQTVSGLNPVIVLRLVNLGLGLVGSSTTYSVFVKDLGPTEGKSIATTIAPSLITPTNNYYNNYQFLYSSTLGPPANSLVQYKQFGKDLLINFYGQVSNASKNIVGTLAIRFNGIDVFVMNTRTIFNNTTVPIHGSKRLKMVDLLALGALPLATSFTVSFFATGTGSNFSSQPFIVDIQYV